MSRHRLFPAKQRAISIEQAGNEALGRRRFVQVIAATALASALPTVFAANESGNSALNMGASKSKTVETNGIRMYYVEQGAGPLVLLCHGFPESWFSWRHQLPALAAAGYRAVAPDMRGYGKTDRPKDVGAYTIPQLVNDLVGLMDALGEKTCTIVGHDFGSVLAWNACLLRPDRFKAIAALSVPYSPRGAVAPIPAFRRMVGDRFFYILYFQEPNVADAEMESDVGKTLRAFYFTYSAEGEVSRQGRGPVFNNGKLLDTLIDPGRLPTWINEVDFSFYVAEFTRTGFTGPLNWYRNLDKNWELMAAYQEAKISVPAVFIAGEQDPVQRQTRRNFERLPEMVPGLTKTVLIPQCGHWTQQEKPNEVNAELLKFLRRVAA